MTLRRLARPSLADLVFVVLVLAVPLTLTDRLLNSDGDLGRHIRVGETILREGGLFYQDRFSYTVAGKAFVPYEWLSEIAFALAHRAAGIPGVVALSAVLFALTAMLVAVLLERRGVDPLLGYLAALLGAALASSHLLARPHLFTLLAAAALLFLLERARPAPLWAYALLFAVWANLHGGFLFGLVMIAVYAAGELAERWRDPGDAAARGRLRHYAAALAVATAACALNPAGPKLFAHVFGYLGSEFMVDNTQEYQSPDFHSTTGRVFLAVLLALIAGLAHDPARPRYTRLGALLATTAFALHSNRNIALFGVTAVPIMALQFDAAWRRWQAPGLARVRAVFAADAGDRSTGPWAVGAAVLVALAALAGGVVGGARVMPAGLSPVRFPVEAVARAREAGLGGRLFSEMTWGGYLLYAWPEQKVFIDGQTDLYGEAISRDYVRIYFGEPGWREELKEWDVSLLIVPPRSRLAYELRDDRRWERWHADSTAVVLRRVGGVAVRTTRDSARPDPVPARSAAGSRRR